MGKDRNPQLKGWRKGDVTTAIFDRIADNPSTIRDIANATGCSMSSIRAYVKTWEKQGVITFDLVETARGAYYAKRWRLVRDNTNEGGTRA